MSFIARRLGFSILVLFGVVLITFGLFRVAAGDPAAALLGKNPTAEEVESLRDALGSDLPVLYGHWRATEAFKSADFSAGGGISEHWLGGGAEVTGQALELDGGTVTLPRNFSSGSRLECRLEGTGEIIFGDMRIDFSDGAVRCDIPDELETLVIAGRSPDAAITRMEFFRYQDNGFNSQFFAAIGEIVRFKSSFPYLQFFNFGETVTTREPIGQLILRALGPSLALMVPIFLGELFFGVLFALLAAAWKDSIADRLIVVLSVAGMSVSYLVLIIFGQWLFGYYWNIFPIWGYGALKYLILPVAIGIIAGIGSSVRFYRTVFVNELNSEYLRTARAKGCSPLSIYGKHLLRNGAIAIATRASATIPFLFTGSLLLESFFGIPGLGFMGIDALYNSDLQLLKALVVAGSLLFVAVNLVTDLAYAWIDPRMR